jgi:1,4-dihydroxy-2-naphthoyl-CoA synthase
VTKLAEELLEKFPECLRYTKQQVNFWKDLSWHLTVPHAQDWLALHFATSEPHEGMRAFVEKRPPDIAGIRKRLADGEAPEFLPCPHCGRAR